MRRITYLAAALLFVLHQDVWFWDDATLVLGFVPISFLYHVLYCIAASLCLCALVCFAWPRHLDDETVTWR